MTADTSLTARSANRLSTGGVTLSQIAWEIRGYFRSPDSLVFNFLFPVALFLLFTSIFRGTGQVATLDGVTQANYADYELAAMIASGIFLSGLQVIAIEVAIERTNGSLKRYGGTPLSPLTYFVGKMGMVYFVSFVQIVLLMLVATLGFGATLPSDPGHWLNLLWLWLLGSSVFAILGVALSALPRSTRGTTAVVVPISLALQFISGVYLPSFLLPTWLANFSAIFPLKWLAQGLREVFLPDGFKTNEVGGAWQLWLVLVMLLAWGVVGLVLARLTFRWQSRDR